MYISPRQDRGGGGEIQRPDHSLVAKSLRAFSELCLFALISG